MRFTHPSNILARHIFLFYFNYLMRHTQPFSVFKWGLMSQEQGVSPTSTAVEWKLCKRKSPSLSLNWLFVKFRPNDMSPPPGPHTRGTHHLHRFTTGVLYVGDLFFFVRFPHHGPFALAHWSPSSRTHPPGHSRWKHLSHILNGGGPFFCKHY